MTINALETYRELGLATVEQAKKQNQSLQQEQFLELLTTQLTHQDPLKPMENGEFLGQMAQFSTVSGIQDLQTSFKDFARSISSDQALQAASLVGRFVSAPTSEGLLGAGGILSGSFELPKSTADVQLKISDPLSGETVRTINLGDRVAGEVAFEWDGMTANGDFADPGLYKVQVEADIDGNNTVLQTHLKSQVESVTMANGNHGLQVNLAGLGPIDFNQIKQIL